MVLKIRDARVEDAAATLRIYNHEVLEGVATLDIETRTLAEQRRWIEDRLGGRSVVVAETNRQLVGFAALSTFRDRGAYSTTVENSIYVATSARQRGIGRALLNELISQARALGYHCMIARIVGDNHSSLALHRSLGYSLVGIERQVARKFGRWLDVTEMQLILADPVG